MKKLIIAAAIVCAAVAANAAVANWKFAGNNVFDGTGSTAETAKWSGAAFIFDAGLMTQSALFSYWEKGGTIGSSTSGYVTDVSFSTAAGAFQQEAGYKEQGSGNSTFYLVLVDTDQVYFSNEKTVAAGSTSTAKNVAFQSQNNGTTTFSAVAPAGTGYDGAGKWASSPEPTSALLMLLGVAGLALRRKQK